MITYIIDRINYLRKQEFDFFNKSVNPEFFSSERTIFRSMSNEFNARRNELEQLLDLIEKEEINELSGRL